MSDTNWENTAKGLCLAGISGLPFLVGGAAGVVGGALLHGIAGNTLTSMLGGTGRFFGRRIFNSLGEPNHHLNKALAEAIKDSLKIIKAEKEFRAQHDLTAFDKNGGWSALETYFSRLAKGKETLVDPSAENATVIAFLEEPSDKNFRALSDDFAARFAGGLPPEVPEFLFARLRKEVSARFWDRVKEDAPTWHAYATEVFASMRAEIQDVHGDTTEIKSVLEQLDDRLQKLISRGLPDEQLVRLIDAIKDAVDKSYDRLSAEMQRGFSEISKKQDDHHEVTIDTLKDQHSEISGTLDDILQQTRGSEDDASDHLGRAKTLEKDGNYQRSAEEAQCAAAKADEPDLRGEALELAAHSWMLALNFRTLQPGTHPRTAKRSFHSCLDEAEKILGSTGRIKHLRMMQAALEGDMEEVVRLADVIAESSESDRLIAESILTKCEALARLERYQEALDSLTNLIESDRSSEGQSWRMVARAVRLKIFGWMMASNIEVEDSFLDILFSGKPIIPQPSEHTLMIAEAHEAELESFLKFLEEEIDKKNATITDGLNMLTMLSRSYTDHAGKANGNDLPELGTRMMDASIQCIEKQYELQNEGDDFAALAELAYDIAEKFADGGHQDKALSFLSKGEEWVQVAKDCASQGSETPWPWLRARSLACRGRTLYRLAEKLDAEESQRFIFDAESAFSEARDTATQNQEFYIGNFDVFRGEMTYWIGQCQFFRKEFEKSATTFRDARTTTNMIDERFAIGAGSQAWFNEGQSLLRLGNKDGARKVFHELSTSTIARQELKTKAEGKVFYIDIGWPVEDL